VIIERLHEHIVEELQQNSRSEVVFVGVAIALNLVTMGINSGLASNTDSTSAHAVLVVTMALVLVVNQVVVSGLRKGAEIKTKLLNGLVKMYQDEKVADYYDLSLLDAYKSRFRQYLIGVLATGVASFVVPIIVLVTT
jgi:hypothetical protein